MTDRNNRIEIPEYVVREEDRKKFAGAFSSRLQACNNAYKSLVAMPDLDNIPDNLQEINADDVEAFINDRLAEISSTKMFTSEKKKEAKEEWEKVKKDALSYIATIKEVITAYQDADICINNGEVVCNNVDMVVREHCKVKTPDGVKEWADLIQDVRDAIGELWNFEREHDLPTGTLISLGESLKLIANPMSLVEAWFFMAWRTDYISRHPYLRGGYEVSMKNGLKEQNDRLAELRKKHFEEHPEEFISLGNKTNPYENQRGSLDNRDYSVEMK